VRVTEDPPPSTGQAGTDAAIDEPGAPVAGVLAPPVPDADPAPRERPTLPRIPRLVWVTSGLWVATVLAALVVTFLPSGYLVDAPGSALDTSRLVTVPDSVPTYSHPGGFRLVTVAETNRPIFGQALVGWLDPDTDVFPRSEVLGDTPRADEVRYQLVLMQNAKHSAVYQAMAVLGMSAKMTGGGVFVDQIVEHSPADGVLNIGDTITAIDGKQISTVDDITRFMSGAKPGQKVTITVDRLGVSQSKKLEVTLGSTERDGTRAPFLGIYMETRPHYRFPFDVGFDTGDIGGPSAGLALTLSLIDKLSKQGLTGGREIAVTGTMQVDGSVGPIGGIRQKVAAVRDAGVHYFLVPTANAADACAAIGDPYPAPSASKTADPHGATSAAATPACGDATSGLRVIPVKSLDDALAQLRKLPGKQTH
jgi:PDZ domain-containing protein